MLAIDAAPARNCSASLCNDLNTGHAARKLLESWRNACGTYLGRLAAKQPSRVKEARTATRREFAVLQRAD